MTTNAERCRASRLRHIDERRAAEQRWKDEHPDEMRSYKTKYRWTDAGKESLRRSNTKRRSATKDIVELFDRVEVFTRDSWMCVGCGKKLNQETATIDHIMPVSKAPSGFVYRNEDVQTMCQPCNASKGAKVAA